MGKSDNQSKEMLSNNLGEKLLTVKEVANIIEETPHIVRNWLKELKDYIPLEKNENGYNMFGNQALEQLKLIKQLHRRQNYSIKQIQHYFVTGGESYKPVPKKGTDEILAEELRKMREEIQALREYSEKQEEFNKALINKLEQQDRYIKETLERRDQLIINQMRNSLEEQKGLAIESADNKDSMVSKRFEDVGKQLQEIKQQQSELKDGKRNEAHFNKLTGQIEVLTQQLQEMKQAMRETTASKEQKKKPWWKLFS